MMMAMITTTIMSSIRVKPISGRMFSAVGVFICRWIGNTSIESVLANVLASLVLKLLRLNIIDVGRCRQIFKLYISCVASLVKAFADIRSDEVETNGRSGQFSARYAPKRRFSLCVRGPHSPVFPCLRPLHSTLCCIRRF